MERFVTMTQVPENLNFPPDLRDRIRYEPERHRLVHRGFMSKAEFDRLCELSPDWNYRRPLEELFRLCSAGAEKTPVMSRLFSAFGR